MLTKIILKILKQNDLCVSDVLKKSLLHEQSFFSSSGRIFKGIIEIRKFRRCVSQELKYRIKNLESIQLLNNMCLLVFAFVYLLMEEENVHRCILHVYSNKLLENDSVAEVSTSTKA